MKRQDSVLESQALIDLALLDLKLTVSEFRRTVLGKDISKDIVLYAEKKDNFVQINLTQCKPNFLIQKLFLLDSQPTRIKDVLTKGWSVQVASVSVEHQIRSESQVTMTNSSLLINQEALYSKYQSRATLVKRGSNFESFGEPVASWSGSVGFFKPVVIRSNHFTPPAMKQLDDNHGKIIGSNALVINEHYFSSAEDTSTISIFSNTSTSEASSEESASRFLGQS